MFDVRDLRYFVAVAEELHFGRAAERLHMSQPPLSQHIRRMEEQLGAQLFHRTTRRVWLTDVGRVLLVDARALLVDAKSAVRHARAVAAGEEGRLDIGAITPAMDSFLPRAVRAFRESSPGIALSLAEMSTDAQLDALRSDRLHLGFVRLFDQDAFGVSSRVVHRERLIAAVPDDSALANRKTISLSALGKVPFVGLARHVQPTLTDRVTAALAAASSHPVIVQTASTVHGVTALVAAGIGAAIVPQSVGTLNRDGVAFRPIRGKLPRVEISAVWRTSDASPLLPRFLASVRGRL